METALYLAALLIALVGVAHSWLGERYILGRLFRRAELPHLFGGPEFTRNTLRFAWHLTTVAWLGFAVLLLQLADPPLTIPAVGGLIAAVFLVHGLAALIGSRGRHLSWPVFLAIAALAWWATRP